MNKVNNKSPKRYSVTAIIVLIVVLVTSGAVWIKSQTNLVPLRLPNTTPLSQSNLVEKTSTVSALSNKETCDCAWAISGTSNLEFVVIDPDGRREGYIKDTNSYANELPDASYGPDTGASDDSGGGTKATALVMFNMNSPKNGTYILQIIGKEPGNYHVEISFTWGPNDSKLTKFDGLISEGQVNKYRINIPEGKAEEINN
jgi:hypothetical protein